jgi:acylphosphatase
MVSAKFHIRGEGGDWFRIRIQEEVYAHGLEGNVLSAEDTTIVVVVEGERERIQKFQEDVIKICPHDARCSGIKYDVRRGASGLIGLMAADAPRDGSAEHVLALLQQLERRMMRLEMKMNQILTLFDGGAQMKPKPPAQGDDVAESMDVPQEAVSGFSSLFGD